jgi:photosystem II stability/assembly factor-like uncharacterized protein
VSAFNRSIVASAFLAAGSLAVPMEADDGDDHARLQAWQAHEAMKDGSPFRKLRWQFLGPTNISGRVTDVAVATPRGDTYRIFAATASGGLWRTDNDGTSWDPVLEHAPSTSVGDVTIAPSDQDIVWVGLGESNIFRSSMAGAGVMKSTDGGETWEHKGLTDTHTIPRIVIHPENPDVLYVASSGHEWTDNDERGVYKSTDGGETWDHILFVNDRTGVIDLVMDPEDPSTLYAATWQRIRRHWNDPRNEPGYGESGIYKTTDGGANWTRLSEGLPDPAVTGRIGLDVARSNPNVVYAYLDSYEAMDAQGGRDSYGRANDSVSRGAEIYRSDDKGATWTRTSETRIARRIGSTYGWVFGQIRVDPTDEDRIYVMGVQLYVSEDAGATFRTLRGMHVDHHAMWIDPTNPDYIVNGNDGGVAITHDGGRNWRLTYDTMPVVQFYNVAFDMDDPFHIYGSIQDHGSRRARVDFRRGRRIRPMEWENAPGGEGSSHAIDPTNPSTVYSAGFYGSISRTDLATGERIRTMPVGTDDDELRGQWIAPFIISPHNPRIVYLGLNHLYRSLDRDDFQKISPDLTHNDPDKMGDIPYQTITAISESPKKFGKIYAGTDDGRLHVTNDGGATWTDITAGLAEDRWISRVIASAYDEHTVFVAQNGKRNDDFQVYLFKSTDSGATWTDISANIPDAPVNVIREDPKGRKILYVGTDLGMYVSVDGGGSWHSLAGNLPTTFVHDIAIHPRDSVAVIATHGRGMWALDVAAIRFAAFFGPAELVKQE